MTSFSIQIVSDTICPWCYIGARRLLRAIEAHLKANPSDTFSLNWHAFYLEPDAAPYPGVNKRRRMEAKFGGPKGADGLITFISNAGTDEGIKFTFSGNTGSTTDSHRLIFLVGKYYGPSEQTKVVQELFRAYFEDGKNITDKKVLVEAVVNSGAPVSAGEAYKWLDSSEGSNEVQQEIRQALLDKVVAVPTFSINGKYSIVGAEHSFKFSRAFDEIKRASNRYLS